MKLNGNSYFLIVIMVLMLVFIGLSLQMESIKIKVLPLAIGSIVFVLAAIILSREILTSDKPVAEASTISGTEGREKDEKGIIGYLPIGAWVVGFFLAIYLLGFIIAIPLFVLAYMKLHGIKWLLTVISTIFVPLIVYSIFELALRIELYRGLVFNLFGS